MNVASYLPASDAIVVVDVKRMLNQTMPGILGGDAAKLADANAEVDKFKTKTGIDLHSIDRVVIGVHYTYPTPTSTRLETVAIAHGTFDARALAASARAAANGKSREEKYRGATITIVNVNDDLKLLGLWTMRVNELAICLLDQNSLALGTPANVRAAEIATREVNAGYLTVMLEGKYTDAYLADAGNDAPKYTAEDLRIISSPVDFVGLNVYTPHHYVVAADNDRGFSLVPLPASFPQMDAPWLKIAPEAMYWAPRHAAKIWGVKSIYISENGTSSIDQPAADGGFYDVDRIMYLRNHLMHLQRATSEGVPVDGYFLWSLMDNFEWTDGFEKRFGLYFVDFKTQRRTPKLSASFYREVIARNTVA